MPSANIEVYLKPGREKKIRNFYPWVQREEVLRTNGTGPPGTCARILSHAQEFLGTGFYNPLSRFAVKMLTLEDRAIDRELFKAAFEKAVSRRAPLEHQTSARRIVFGEADSLPGLIVDQYDNTLVLQVRAAGMELLRDTWQPVLIEVVKPDAILERSDMEGRKEEGLEPFTGWIHGSPKEEVVIHEHNLQYIVPIEKGLKTGFYVDQRDNRRHLREVLSKEERVLDLFTYTSGFALNAALAGAQVTAIDLNEVAIEIANRNFVLNGLNGTCILANAFEYLESYNGMPFTFIVIDPPAISKSQATRSSLQSAIYKLVRLSLNCLALGGRILVCSCSYQFSLDSLIETTRKACSDSNRKMFIENVSFQPPDHPYLAQFPESLYLKAIWCRID